MSTREAFVTGVPGWAGDALLRALLESDTYGAVRCLAATGVPRGGEVEHVTGDLRDAGSLDRFFEGAEGADVFHFAGLIHPRHVSDLEAVNAQGTRNLVAAADRAGARRIVALSSNSPVGVSRDPDTVFDENTPCRPYLAYGRSKLAMEKAVQVARSEWTILRPCWFYGPGQPERQTEFFRMVRAGKAPLVGGGRARRSVSYVDAIASAALLAASADIAARRVYWIADERPYPMAEIVDTIEAVLRDDFGLSVKGGRTRLPARAADVAHAVDAAMQRVGRYDQRVHVLGEMNKTIACSVERAKSELGWNPGPGLREGMRRSVEWCLTNGHEI
jgi:nucleoside-diphosphate-sugar epimerase